MNFLRAIGFCLGDLFDRSSYLAIENDLWELFGRYPSEYSEAILSCIVDFSYLIR